MEYKKLSKKNIKYYHLIEEIGKGATGKVWLSVDERKNELLAIKAIPNGYLKKEEGSVRLKSELQNLHKLKHKNIIQIRGYETTKNNTYIALEYCNGGNLHEYQKFYQKTTKTTLNELYIQKIMKQITAGLEYMHLNKIIHRDIKLENILINFDKYPNLAIKGKLPPKVKYENISLSDSFTIKIADLGFSKDIEVSNITATVLGTPINMSPDIVNNYVSDETKSYNTSVDLWSLGAITYELLTGKQAFSGSQFKEVFKQIMEGKYSLPSSMVVSVEIISFINGLLQFYPEKRLNWDQIKTHPFLTKSTENFTYIELKSIAEGDKKNIELNSKNCDNLLWILFKGKLNLGLDKLNMKEIKGKDLKQSIMDNTVNNEEIKKAIENEKKKIKEEAIRLEKEKLEAENLKKEAEKLKNEVNLIKQKNEEREKKLKDEELKRKEMEEKLKKEGELNQQKEQEIQKQMNEYQKQLQQLEKEKNENDQKLKNAEKLLKNAEKLQKDTENQIKTLEKNKEEEAKKRKEEEEKMKQKEKELIEEKNKFEKEIEKIKEEQNKKNENFEQEKNKMLKQIEEMNKAKNDLEKEVVHKNKEIENELQKKEFAIKEYKDKIKNMTDAKDLEIQKYEEERKKLELLQDKIKNQVENLKNSLSAEINKESGQEKEKKEGEQKDNIINDEKKEIEDKTENLKINDENVEKDEDDSFDDFKKDWVICDKEETQSVNFSDKDEKNEKIDDNDFLKDYEIIESFNDKDEKEAISKKIEI